DEVVAVEESAGLGEAGDEPRKRRIVCRDPGAGNRESKGELRRWDSIADSRFPTPDSRRGQQGRDDQPRSHDAVFLDSRSRRQSKRARSAAPTVTPMSATLKVQKR